MNLSELNYASGGIIGFTKVQNPLVYDRHYYLPASLVKNYGSGFFNNLGSGYAYQLQEKLANEILNIIKQNAKL